MTPKYRSTPSSELPDDARDADRSAFDIPAKEEILEDISEGYRFVMSGGKGQPVDEMHREIAEELAREEVEENADIRL